MFNVREWPSGLRVELDSEPRYVERAIREVMFFFEKRGGKSSLEINIIVRELLRNAIEHGNLNIASRRVSFTFELVDHPSCRITVEDEGDGFPNPLADLPADPRRKQSRGLALTHKLAERLEFNERGNKVSALVRMEDDEQQVGLTGTLGPAG